MKMEKLTSILIVGNGNIGKHICKEFELLQDLIVLHDPYQNLNADLSKHYDFAFICLPTEMLQDGKCDTSIIESVTPKINADVIIIKSAIPPGTCKKLNMKNIVISPEYYGTTIHSLESPNVLVLGGEKENTSKVAQLYYQIKSSLTFKIIFTNWETAELAKYMENCWLATKVTFCSEFYDISKSLGISYEELREIFISDCRVNPSHTFVYEDHPYYNSHCLNKDIPGLITFCKERNINTPLIESVNEINISRKLST